MFLFCQTNWIKTQGQHKKVSNKKNIRAAGNCLEKISHKKKHSVLIKTAFGFWPAQQSQFRSKASLQGPAPLSATGATGLFRERTWGETCGRICPGSRRRPRQSQALTNMSDGGWQRATHSYCWRGSRLQGGRWMMRVSVTAGLIWIRTKTTDGPVEAVTDGEK